jgi:hypothetical protein
VTPSELESAIVQMLESLDVGVAMSGPSLARYVTLAQEVQAFTRDEYDAALGRLVSRGTVAHGVGATPDGTKFDLYLLDVRVVA